jgi:hypothetical protein
MNLPGETASDRRAVPRHIRDGEHDMIDEAMGQVPPPQGWTGRRVWLWICVAVTAAAGFGLWLTLRPRG